MIDLTRISEVNKAIDDHRNYWKDRHYARGVDQLIEEMSELIKTFMKNRRQLETHEEITEEMADVYFCLELLVQEMENESYIIEQVKYKASRLTRKLAGGEDFWEI